MKKEELLEQLSKKLDEIPMLDSLELTWFGMTLNDYNPDNSKLETKVSYRQFEINLEKSGLVLIDMSEPFKCTMGYKECIERGECNGDC